MHTPIFLLQDYGRARRNENAATEILRVELRSSRGRFADERNEYLPLTFLPFKGRYFVKSLINQSSFSGDNEHIRMRHGNKYEIN